MDLFLLNKPINWQTDSENDDPEQPAETGNTSKLLLHHLFRFILPELTMKPSTAAYLSEFSQQRQNGNKTLPCAARLVHFIQNHCVCFFF